MRICIVSWFTENRSDLLSLGSASYRLSEAVLTCWHIYMSIRHGDTSKARYRQLRRIAATGDAILGALTATKKTWELVVIVAGVLTI